MTKAAVRAISSFTLSKEINVIIGSKQGKVSVMLQYSNEKLRKIANI